MENKKSTEAKGDAIMKKEDFAVLWKSIRLKVTDTYDVPPEILWVNGSTIGTLGNFSASTGKAKSKKTFNISAIVAAALTNDEVLHYSACLPPDKRNRLRAGTQCPRGIEHVPREQAYDCKGRKGIPLQSRFSLLKQVWFSSDIYIRGTDFPFPVTPGNQVRYSTGVYMKV